MILAHTESLNLVASEFSESDSIFDMVDGSFTDDSAYDVSFRLSSAWFADLSLLLFSENLVESDFGLASVSGAANLQVDVDSSLEFVDDTASIALLRKPLGDLLSSFNLPSDKLSVSEVETPASYRDTAFYLVVRAIDEALAAHAEDPQKLTEHQKHTLFNQALVLSQFMEYQGEIGLRSGFTANLLLSPCYYQLSKQRLARFKSEAELCGFSFQIPADSPQTELSGIVNKRQRELARARQMFQIGLLGLLGHGSCSSPQSSLTLAKRSLLNITQLLDGPLELLEKSVISLDAMDAQRLIAQPLVLQAIVLSCLCLNTFHNGELTLSEERRHRLGQVDRLMRGISASLDESELVGLAQPIIRDSLFQLNLLDARLSSEDIGFYSFVDVLGSVYQVDGLELISDNKIQRHRANMQYGLTTTFQLVKDCIADQLAKSKLRFELVSESGLFEESDKSAVVQAFRESLAAAMFMQDANLYGQLDHALELTEAINDENLSDSLEQIATCLLNIEGNLLLSSKQRSMNSLNGEDSDDALVEHDGANESPVVVLVAKDQMISEMSTSIKSVSDVENFKVAELRPRIHEKLNLVAAGFDFALENSAAELAAAMGEFVNSQKLNQSDQNIDFTVSGDQSTEQDWVRHLSDSFALLEAALDDLRGGKTLLPTMNQLMSEYTELIAA